ncbi:hypothetical protein HXX76_006650 [Chlamydomonas incerta]|uniref:Small ribosomal subunit protein uS9c n=1 Tax=Chlamydomonas incerta TaxID=51695 RepID=A0A835TDQ2_CHLIN|nr:hypothetical protein HXX76_006650 [Chlamydomonas incerta]|eukprot:KAG2436341.1 hypothetical protein HXX76_006650 [Chlamydomonas incerta]
MVRGGAASAGPSSLALVASALSTLQQQVTSHAGALFWALGSRQLAAPAVPGGTSQQDRTPSAKPGTAEPELKLNFSLRPSVLSPLFPAWEQTRQTNQRREHLVALLDAHQQLAEGLRITKDGVAGAAEGADADGVSGRKGAGGVSAGVVRAARRRARNLQQVASQLRSLLDASPGIARGVAGLPTACPSPAHATAYCAALEAALTTPDAAAAGTRDFGALQPLEVIFSRPDPAEVVRQMRRAAREQAALGGSGSGGGGSGGSAGPGLDFPATSTSAEPAGPHIDLAGVTHARGKRKASAASVQLVPAGSGGGTGGGGGGITVNGVPLAAYFRDPACRDKVLAPLALAGAETAYDVAASVKGGGMMGQAQAVATALARALCVQQPSLGATAGDGGSGGREEGPLAALTRWDGRVVERKKPGQAGSRRGFQWVKR